MRCEFYQRKQLNNKNDMVRVESSFIGITKEDIVTYWFNPPIDLIKAVTDFRIIERISPDEIVVYLRVKMPMMTDRDQVVHLKVFRGDDQIFIREQSVERHDAPPVKGAIRMFVNLYALLYHK